MSIFHRLCFHFAILKPKCFFPPRLGGYNGFKIALGGKSTLVSMLVTMACRNNHWHLLGLGGFNGGAGRNVQCGAGIKRLKDDG